MKRWASRPAIPNLARRHDDIAIRLLPILDQRRRRGCRAPAAAGAPSCRRKRSPSGVGVAALRTAKRRLALEVTTILHGEDAAGQADAAAQALFSGARDISNPTTVVSLADAADGLTIADAFIRAGLCSSRGDARRLAQQGGLSINDEKVENVDLLSR
ncbi:MAG: S4 domain-containing protein [Thermomicrobiales bacterium]